MGGGIRPSCWPGNVAMPMLQVCSWQQGPLICPAAVQLLAAKVKGEVWNIPLLDGQMDLLANRGQGALPAPAYVCV